MNEIVKTGIAKAITITIVMGAALLVSRPALAELQSLRGAAIQEGSIPAEQQDYIDDDQLVERNFLQQPPVIPHDVEGMRVNLRANKCLSCHSPAKYKRKKATKISITHFRDRAGEERSHVAHTRYFCRQCHVPQVTAPALVGNRFEPVEALKLR